MRIDPLPTWAATALNSVPVFGSDPDSAPEGDPAGATVTDPPEDKPEADKPVNIDPDDFAKTARERDQAKQELLALQQEKQEREEADAAAQAATRSKEENQAAELESLKKDNQALATVNEYNLLELAVLKNKKFEWNDHTIVQKLVDKSGIKIDVKKGTVEGVDEALKALAKEHPYLLKKSEGNGDGNGSQGTPLGTPANASGGTPAGSKDASAKANKRRELEKRFNVLRV
jgi:hypothetical protein